MSRRAAPLIARGLLGLLPVLALVTAGCHRGAEQAAKEAKPVLTVAVAPASTRELTSTLTLTGAIAAWQPLSVSPAANGLAVVEVLAEEGQRVTKGQVLARLDDRLIRAQLADARARLASAEANRQKARFPSRPEDLSSARAGVADAEARFKGAETDYERFRQLQAEGGVSRAELDARATALASARAALQQARDRAGMMQVGGRAEDVRIAEASVAQARAAVEQMTIQLAQTQVVAPAAGVILKKDVLLGDVAAVGKPMFTLARDNRLEMAGNVAEADMPKLAPGQAVAVVSDALPGLRAAGRVRLVSPSLSTTSRLGTVKIDLPPNTGFKPGMFARGTVTLGRTETLAVPTEAVLTQDGRSRVFVVKEGVAHAREVEAGDGRGAWTPILAGLAAGEPVVTEGAAFLKDGDAVGVAEATGAAAPAGGR